MGAICFRFIEFNPRRAMRGVEAARVAVIDNGQETWCWMSKRDLSRNMMVFGPDEELERAYDAYTTTQGAEQPAKEE